MIRHILVTFLLTSCLLLHAQDKKKIDYTCYDEWRTIKTTLLSTTGRYVVYDSAPLAGDAVLYIYNSKNDTTISFSRGKTPTVLKDESALVFLVEPQFDTVRKLKLAEASKEKFPKDSLFIYWPAIDSTLTFGNIKSYAISKDANTLVFLSQTDQRADCPELKKKKKKKKNSCSKPATNGTSLTILNTATGKTTVIHCTTSFKISDNGEKVLYTQSLKGKKDTLSLVLYNLIDSTYTTLIDKQYGLLSLTFDQAGEQIAFLGSSDTNKIKNYSLYYYSAQKELTGAIVDSMNSFITPGWGVSEFGNVFFSDNGEKIYFGTNKLVVQDAEDTLLDSEIAKVDIWGSEDLRIQSQQLTELPNDRKKAFKAVYLIGEKRMVQIETPDLAEVQINPALNQTKLLGKNETPYLREYTWEYPWKADYYLVDEQTGLSTLLATGIGFTNALSPSGKYFVYYSGIDSSWNSINTNTGEKTNLSNHIDAIFASDNNGNPALPDEQGFVGWTMHEKQEYAIVNSRFDLWMLNPTAPEKHHSLTNDTGSKQNIQFDYYRIDNDSIYTQPNNNYLIGTDYVSKDESIYGITYSNNQFQIERLLKTEHRITLISKSDTGNKIIIRKMSFTEYPDLEITDTSFQALTKISDINPQQIQYNWGTVEFVTWKSFEGRNLRGLLYKPEDFDSTKSYPMIVYFYEKYTQDIHIYYAPKPTASIVFPTEYVSNGYIIFIPDIEYTPGYPAKSAYDCIVSGTDYLTHKYRWIDSTRLGLQGQSWGGYQTAQLITMTTKYKAAMAGAPVSNMFSAYGGIRWGSGFSRMFQYEKTQSRIGYTIWERPDLYMQNSPVFGLPRVNTPLLIMSNDGDGAVPWYQGIELYMGLRRLGKPVWMLNYNDDEHNLTQLANKRDLSIRMRQFFDYYLLGAPMPEWMSTGVKAIDKGKTFGFETENSSN